MNQPSESEWRTRKKRIDEKLKAANCGWQIVPYTPGLDVSTLHGVAVEEYPTDSGPADYALFVCGCFAGIIEAKKVGVGPANVLEQAKRYSRGAYIVPAAVQAGQWGEYFVPLLYELDPAKWTVS